MKTRDLVLTAAAGLALLVAVCAHAQPARGVDIPIPTAQDRAGPLTPWHTDVQRLTDGSSLRMTLLGRRCKRGCEFEDTYDPAVLVVQRRSPGHGVEEVLRRRYGCRGITNCDGRWIDTARVMQFVGYVVLQVSILRVVGAGNVSFTDEFEAWSAEQTRFESLAREEPTEGELAKAAGIREVFKYGRVGETQAMARGVVTRYELWRGGDDGDAMCCPKGGIVEVTFEVRQRRGRLVLVPTSYVKVRASE